jgi:FdhD protein
MGRITERRPIVRIDLDAGTRRRVDTLAVEEPLELRIGGAPLAITMRTPGHDVELATGFLVSEGVITGPDDLRGAIHCGGPGTGGVENTYNVLDLTLAPGVAPPAPERARTFMTTSACGLCGAASIDAVEAVSAFDPAADALTVTAGALAALPGILREHQAVFDRTGGLHAAALFDVSHDDGPELLVLREDVGRHNAVDKVIGWAVVNRGLPAAGLVLQVSGRASFELVQKAVMAGIPVLAAVSAPSSLAVDLAVRSGLTLVGFVRGRTMNIYSRSDRVLHGE